MIVFLIITVVYIGLLSLIKPAPTSLKANPLTYTENVSLVWASMFTGTLILGVFLIITEFGFTSVNGDLFRVLALNNDFEQFLKRPLKSISHLFIHGNLTHLIMNLVGLGLMSVYERRVGYKRYFAVFIVGGLASIPSIFFYSGQVFICGISGAVFGLAAAYFTDEKELTMKEWLSAILQFFFLFFIVTFLGGYKSAAGQGLAGMQVDHIGHLLGASAAVIYCRLNPLRLNA